VCKFCKAGFAHADIFVGPTLVLAQKGSRSVAARAARMKKVINAESWKKDN
jgi:hypothetical protein